MPLTARRDVECCVCGSTIARGSPVTPLANDGGKALNWSHIDCVQPDDARIPVCKHWRTKGMCIFRDTCQFRHPEEEKNGSDRLRQRYGTWARYRIYNEGRAGSLRRWLVDVFGSDFLSSGSGILDVAGGKGELSFELNNLSGIRSTVVDPRPLEVSRYRKKLHYGFYHSNQVLGTYNVRLNPGDFSMHVIPPHLRMFFEFDPEAGAAGASGRALLPLALRDEDSFLEETRRAVNTAWTSKGLVHEDGGSGDEGGGEGIAVTEPSDAAESVCSGRSSCVFDEAEDNVVLDYGVAVDAVSSCSMLIGMHPDQAAGHIVDFALQSGKPFALVPCCVYHKQFPHRKLPNGDPVKKYSELIEYLMAKDSGIRAVEMDFEGKNILLYHLGRDHRGHTLPRRDPALPVDLMCRGPASADQWRALADTKHPAHCRCKDDHSTADV